MQKRIDEIMAALTLEEKCSLCSGSSFWHLTAIDRLGLKQIMVTDGPHGLRKQRGDTDHIGLSKSVHATCFPTAATTASAWDADMMHKMGEALAEEALQEQVSVILGPGANIKRSPLCGRNFEYISEDPFLSGNTAAALIAGIQSKGVGTSLKHFVLNNQEERRMTIDTVVDERTAREIYLRSFEIAVKKAQPWTVMCSYNRVDGTYLSDHKRLLSDILRDAWGFDGLVVTDWGATNDRVQGIKAGLDLEMPTSNGINDDKLLAAVKDGSLDEPDLDKVVRRIVALNLKSLDNKKEGYTYDQQAHHALAREIAGKSMVLLKNNDLLPLSKRAKVAVIGAFAKTPRYQGSGSSIINPHQVDSLCDELDKQGIDYAYAAGYALNTQQADDALLAEAKRIAKAADVCIVCVGLTDAFESEGFDRSHMDMPQNHNALVKHVAKSNANTVVALSNGAPVTMPWLTDVKAVLECYLGGQAGGGAIADILFGDVNPSGKLAETFPLRIQDNPSHGNFPGSKLTVEYRESIFVGYRYYDAADKDVLFPFGYGLSYTTFAYSNLQLTPGKDGLTVTIDIKNTGDMDGAEVVQVYVKNAPSTLFKAQKELKAYAKVWLKQGEKKNIQFTLTKEAFAYYNIRIADWHVESGEYEVLVGASSRDIRLSQSVAIKQDKPADVPDYSKTMPAYYNLKGKPVNIPTDQFVKLLGKPLPPTDRPDGRPFGPNTMMCETQGTMIGRALMRAINKRLAGMTDDTAGAENGNFKMMEEMVKTMPLRAIALLGGDQLPKYFVPGLIHMLNGKLFKGIVQILKK